MKLRSLVSALAGCGALMASSVFASAQTTTQSPHQGSTSRSGYSSSSRGDTFHAHAQKPPPGYQVAPSTEINHGPDPDHDANIQRDPVTGANLSSFGSAYASSSPTSSGRVGDSTGNGWVSPRGN